ncbi:MULTISPECIES: sensor histidine kinase [Rhizobium/Agrobacterium group]|uniref:histidine kinase n=1 Tax=Rhizobium rhizogenes TaxID=359 RepID=A0A546XNT2_RHIRH|nr:MULTISPECIES: HAMP domain-containing sensor histidine kinase [Rhizobium/Agrobacterium group]MDA5632297.1 HAMP domain-containing sensor histidine kinase [Agrobacterium sp. ST15.16.024]MDF1888160.1 HAMP domain-containing sensor histidine kinase [Rhizobium rhizogenes]TRB02409.1 HAMP domain-containing histidine kinase [Rhizobium rhizogenes]
MREKAVALVDHAAGRWLARMEEDAERRAGTVARLRRLIAFGAVGLLVVPALFSLVFSPAIALPIGAALVLALFLSAAALSIAFSRPLRGAASFSAPAADDDLVAASQVPGLVLTINEIGLVERVSGRDREKFPVELQACKDHVFAEYVYVSDRIELMQAFDLLRQGEDKASAELRFETGAKSRPAQFMHARIEMTAIRSTTGRLRRVVAQLSDVTEMELLRRDVARKAAEAESANDAKSRFLAAVSHELRTPLNAVLGFSDILAGEYFGRLENDRQREYVGLIRQSGAHLLSVVNTMLDMSKLEAGRYELLMESFPIAETISSCEAMLGLQAKEKGLTLTSRIQRGIGEISADQRAIRQVLINLAGNAIKFTDAGGVVSIDAAREGKMLKLTVSDTGIGIASDKIDLLGQPFMQVQNEYTRRYEGTGLGLSLVKGLVALHGGTFVIASQPGEGTVVTIMLPADGSGMAGGEDAETERMVEFPPRIRQLGEMAAIMKKDGDDGPAKAKIA